MRMRFNAVRMVLVAGAAAVALSGCGIFKKGSGPHTPTVGTRIPILSGPQDIVLDPTIAGLEVVLPPEVVNADWGQPGGNASKAPGHLALGATLTEAWHAQIRGGTNRARLAASPVVSDGKLFVIDTEAMVHAFDAVTGRELWSVKIGDTRRDGQRARFGGGVSADAGVVYAVSGLGDVSALDANDGTLRWNTRPSGPLRGAPTLAFGSVYVMGQDNQLFALRATDGVVQWQRAGSVAPGSRLGVGSPAAGQGTIVAGYSSGEVNAYRYENGRELWGDALARTSISMSVSTLADVDANPVIDRGRVYAIGQGGRMASYELVTGSRIWELNIAGISTPWVAGEWVFALTDDDRLLNITRGSGKLRWIAQLPRWHNERKRTGDISWTGPLLAGGRLIAVSNDGRLAQISTADGSIQSLMRISGPTNLAPLVANQMLYVMDEAGRITAFR